MMVHREVSSNTFNYISIGRFPFPVWNFDSEKKFWIRDTFIEKGKYAHKFSQVKDPNKQVNRERTKMHWEHSNGFIGWLYWLTISTAMLNRYLQNQTHARMEHSRGIFIRAPPPLYDTLFHSRYNVIAVNIFTASFKSERPADEDDAHTTDMTNQRKKLINYGVRERTNRL